MIEAELFDGTVLEFPEGTSPDVVARVAKEQTLARKQQPAPAAQDANPPSALARFGAGIQQGIGDVVGTLAQGATYALDDFQKGERRAAVDRRIQERQQQYQQEFGDSGLASTGRILGQIAGTAPTMAVAPLGAATTAARVGNAALQGAAAAGLTSSQSEESLGAQAGTSAAISAALPVAGKVLKGATLDPAVKALQQAGVELTPGQLVGGVLKKLEDASTSLLGVGNIVQNAQRRSLESFNRVAINKALAPIGKTLPKDTPVGREAIDFAERAISKAYDDLVPKLSGQLDQKLADDLAKVQLKTKFLPQDAQGQLASIIDNEILTRIPGNGAFDGKTLQSINVRLGELTRNYSKSLDANQRELGRALREVDDAFKKMIYRVNPQEAKNLTALERASASQMRVTEAAAASGSDAGVFTPAQFSNAVKKLESGKRKKAFGAGRSLMQDISDPAKQVLPSSLNNSGTTDRLMLTSLIGGGAGLAGLTPQALAAAGIIGAAYTKPGVAATKALLSARPKVAQPIGDVVTHSAVPVSTALTTD